MTTTTLPDTRCAAHPAPAITGAQGLALLRTMLLIRRLGERIIPLYPTDVMVTPVHLHIGQEAVPAGVCAHLRREDVLFFTHRSHGPALAKGMQPRKLVAELYGRTTGCSGGFGGSMHLIDLDHGMPGSSAIVGGAIALGVGSALAAKLRNEPRIAVSWFGDGATDTGAFWESINFAALKQVPCLFVCENNHLSNVMPKSQHMHAELHRMAAQFMPSECVDGCDVSAVYAAAQRAVTYVRSERAPFFLECVTKRWMKHQGVETDDLAYNPVDRERDCPILRLRRKLLADGRTDPASVAAVEAEVESVLDDAFAFAERSPFPAPEALFQES